MAPPLRLARFDRATRTTPRRRLLPPSALLFALVATAGSARAEPQAETIAASRALGIEGVELAEAGRCAEAIEKLERAEALYHAPSVLARLGECQIEIGQIVRGTETLNRVVRERLAPDAPEPFRAAQARAEELLDRHLPRIARLVLHIEPANVPADVTVSGVAVPRALLGAERPTDPGTHEVVANAPGYEGARATIHLDEGARQELTLELLPLEREAKRAAKQPAPAAPPAPVSDGAKPRAAEGPGTLPFVLLGVGAAGLAVGTVTGVLAIQRKNELECPSYQCEGAQHAKLDEAQAVSWVSTAGFGVGLVSGVIGAILFVSSSGGEASTGFRLRPYASAASAGISGSF